MCPALNGSEEDVAVFLLYPAVQQAVLFRHVLVIIGALHISNNVYYHHHFIASKLTNIVVYTVQIQIALEGRGKMFDKDLCI